jgi:ubiquinone/menaquinone biosynthesis C-methylase UbiE
MIFSSKKLPQFRAKEASKLVKNMKTLDMGGGDGWLISNVVSPKKITVIDLDKENLKRNPAKKKIQRDLTKNKIKSKSFNQITLFEVIEHVKNEKDRIKIFSEAFRILKPKGKLIISTPNYSRFSTQFRKVLKMPRKYPYAVAGGKGIPFTDWHYYEYSEKTIKKDLEKAGFKKVRTYSKFIQFPFIQNFLDIKHKFGLVLYSTAEK